ncbi:MAG: restriction endonuclease subunit S [Desulfobulbaceae bacterium]|nr:restriction endonuclease subunit S [Desulfobulbaceae bacterium]
MSGEGWKTVTIDLSPIEIIDGDRGRNYPKQEEFYDNEYCLFLNTSNVTPQGFNFEKTMFITSEKDELLKKGKLKRYDIVLTTRGTVGNVAYYDENVPYENIRINSGMVIFRNGRPEDISSQYFYHFLRSSIFQDQVESHSSGSAQPQLPIKDLKRIELPLPPLPTQTRIASILSALDDKIELNRQTNATLEAIAQAIFKEWFVNFRFPGATGEMEDVAGCSMNGAGLEPAPMRLIPKGWRVGKVGDICEVNKNTIGKGDVFDHIEYIEISEVNRGAIGKTSIYSYGTEPSRAKRKLKHGDTVLSTVRPNRGAYFLALNSSSTLIASTGFAVFSPVAVPPSFLYLLLTSSEKLEYYGHVADGGAYPAINPNLIMDIDIVIPGEDALNDFQSVADSLFKKIDNNNRQSATLAKIRDVLLPKLMNGEIPVGAGSKPALASTPKPARSVIHKPVLGLEPKDRAGLEPQDRAGLEPAPTQSTATESPRGSS